MIIPELRKTLQQMEVIVEGWQEYTRTCEEFNKDIKKESRNRVMGVMFLLKLDKRRYRDFLTDIYNSQMQGTFL